MSRTVEAPCVLREVEVLQVRIRSITVNFISPHINNLDRFSNYGGGGTPYLAVEAVMLRCTLRVARMASARHADACVDASKAPLTALLGPLGPS